MTKTSFRDNWRKTIRVLKVIQKISRGYFYSFLALGILQSLLPYISIYFTYRIIDSILIGSPQGAIMTLVYTMIGIHLALGILERICHYFNMIYLVQLNYNLETSISMKTFELDYSQVEDNDVMQLIQKARDGSNGNGGVKLYMEYILTGILTSSLSILYGLILLSGMLRVQPLADGTWFLRALNHPLSALILFIGVLIPALISYQMMKQDNKRSYGVLMSNIDTNRKASYLSQICANYQYGKDIRLFGMQRMIHDQQKAVNKELNENWRGYIIFSAKLMSFNILANKLLTFIAYLYVGLKAIYGLITVGNVVAYVGAITLISQGISVILMRYSKLHLFNNYLDNYFTYLNLQHVKSYGPIDQLDYDHLAIECRDLSFTYPNQTQPTLHHVNLTILPQEKLAIVGLNGAGKTTLIKLICRLYEPTEGDIWLNGIPISSYTKRVMDELLAVVFQDFKLFSYSIKENITAGADNPDLDNVLNVVERSGFGDRVSAMSDGLDTVIYQRNKQNGVEISGGEAQKIAIARALYKNAPIVILDEPTAALDPKSEAEIYEKFQHLVDGKLAIFISHRMSSCKFCDRIVVMEDGHIVEEGTHSALVHANGLYERMWNAQAKYYSPN